MIFMEQPDSRPDLTARQKLLLYRKMVEIRTFEQKVFHLFSTEPMAGSLHQYNGQEAVAVGVCANLTTEDYATSTHRGHGHCIAKGADMHKMMAELFAKDTGSCRAMGGSMHLADFGVGMLGAVAIVGGGIPIAVGAAMTGMLPIAEFQFNDFTLCAMDQICNQAAKSRLMFGGQVSVPVVFRAPIGATGRAAQHSQSLEALFMHVPGLKVAMPSTPYDARGLLKTAIYDPNPVMFFEHKQLYGATSPGGKAKSAVEAMKEFMTPAPVEEYAIPFGVADVKRSGTDATVVATSLMVHRCLTLAKRLEKEERISLEVIDPRTLVPLDKETIFRSIEKTGRLVIVHEAHLRCGFGAELAALVGEEAFDLLDAPVKRVGAMDVPIPFAPACEEYVLPNEQRILDAIHSVLA